MRPSVIVPARNEARSVGEVVSALRRALGSAADVWVVDDGSSDGTGPLAQRAGARVLRLEGVGYGAAIKAAARVIESEWAALIDADGSYLPADLPRLLAEAEQGRRHVIGARPPSGVAESAVRSAVKAGFRAYVRLATGVAIPDLNSGMRVVRTDDLRRLSPLLPDRFSLTTTLTLALLAEGVEPAFVPIAYRPRVGASHWRPVRDTWRMGRAVVRGCRWVSRRHAPAPLLRAGQE